MRKKGKYQSRVIVCFNTSSFSELKINDLNCMAEVHGIIIEITQV